MFKNESGGSVTPDNERPLTRSELEATVARMLDEQLTERIAPLKSGVEHIETQKMLRDTDVERNTQAIRRIRERIYSLELGCDHRDRDVA